MMINRFLCCRARGLKHTTGVVGGKDRHFQSHLLMEPLMVPIVKSVFRGPDVSFLSRDVRVKGNAFI